MTPWIQICSESGFFPRSVFVLTILGSHLNRSRYLKTTVDVRVLAKKKFDEWLDRTFDLIHFEIISQEISSRWNRLWPPSSFPDLGRFTSPAFAWLRWNEDTRNWASAWLEFLSLQSLILILKKRPIPRCLVVRDLIRGNIITKH